MSAWFTSRNSAVALGIITLLTLTARITFLDALYVPEFRTMLPEDQPLIIGVVMLVFMVFIGVWIWSLMAAARGSRAGLVTSLVFCLFTALGGGLLTLLALCPNRCAAWPVGNVIVWANLVSGLAASAGLIFQLMRRQSTGVKTSMPGEMA